MSKSGLSLSISFLYFRLAACASSRKPREQKEGLTTAKRKQKKTVPWNSKSALRAFLASFFSHSSFSSMVHSQFFCLSTSSPRSSASALRRSVSASLRCFSSRTTSRALFLDLEDSSITEARFASEDVRCVTAVNGRLVTRGRDYD